MRNFFYSGSTRGFYVDEVHRPDQIPQDAVPITEQYWQDLLQGQSDGQMIVPNDQGYPILVDYPPPTLEELSERAKQQRNALLDSSDWTQLPDVPQGTKATWAVYRQALRDITQQSGFPISVEWPAAPE